MSAICSRQCLRCSPPWQEDKRKLASRVLQQSTLLSCKPTCKCSILFNASCCTLTWKSNKYFEMPTRFNLLSASESNSSLDLILHMKSNDIQILSAAMINSCIHSILLLYFKVFQDHVFPKQCQSFRFNIFAWTMINYESFWRPGWKFCLRELKTQSWFGAGSFTSQVNMIFPTGYLKMLFLFIYYFLQLWTKTKKKPQL